MIELFIIILISAAGFGFYKYHRADQIKTTAHFKTPDLIKPFRPVTPLHWENSPAHLLFLSKFIKGKSSDYFRERNYWEDVLKEEPQSAIDRFIQEGILEPVDLHARLNEKYKVGDLKEMLKKKALTVSGLKKDLITRLINNDSQEMEILTNDTHLFRCSPSGAVIVGDFLTKEKEKREQAEKNTLVLLEKRQFKSAMQIIAEYESAQVFPRGINMDWEDYANSTHINELITIFNDVPGLLKNIPEEKLHILRIAAGMAHLWGYNYRDPYIPPGFETGTRFDASSCMAMFFHYANYKRNMSGYKNANVKYIEILGCSNRESCAACRDIQVKQYEIDAAPELPYEKCTHKDGCRCSILPVIGL